LEVGGSKRKLECTPYIPGHVYECQKKGDRKWAICKYMKRKNGEDSSERRALSFRMGKVGVHPHCPCESTAFDAGHGNGQRISANPKANYSIYVLFVK
jgi:hypothetical protein